MLYCPHHVLLNCIIGACFTQMYNSGKTSFQIYTILNTFRVAHFPLTAVSQLVEPDIWRGRASDLKIGSLMYKSRTNTSFAVWDLRFLWWCLLGILSSWMLGILSSWMWPPPLLYVSWKVCLSPLFLLRHLFFSLLPTALFADPCPFLLSL